MASASALVETATSPAFTGSSVVLSAAASVSFALLSQLEATNTTSTASPTMPKSGESFNAGRCPALSYQQCSSSVCVVVNHLRVRSSRFVILSEAKNLNVFGQILRFAQDVPFAMLSKIIGLWRTPHSQVNHISLFKAKIRMSQWNRSGR